MARTLKRRILLVDDDPDVRRSLGNTLTKAGYEVITASDGVEAVRLWRDLHGGDLVILDMFMPEKDGLQTIVELRTHSPGVPIIAISGGGASGRLDTARRQAAWRNRNLRKTIQHPRALGKGGRNDRPGPVDQLLDVTWPTGKVSAETTIPEPLIVSLVVDGLLGLAPRSAARPLNQVKPA